VRSRGRKLPIHDHALCFLFRAERPCRANLRGKSTGR
jgi:hypothetical protein